jgi:formyltetrahydrofolate deformylase
VLLIACLDRKGLVADITAILFRRDLNIIHNAEFVEHATGRFFMRTVMDGDLDEADVLAELSAALPAEAEVHIAEKRRKRIVVFASRESHCLGDILVRCAFDEMNAEILAVISNHAILRELTEQFGHPFHHVAHEGLSREAHEAAVREALAPYPADYLVLAKYMRILTPGFVTRHRHRIINIHHSFLPAFAGARPYHQAYERGVKIIGATAHFVNESLDEGPIIAQNVAHIGHQHEPSDIARAGHSVEKAVLAQALDLVFDDRVFVSGNRTILFV